jgi:hypothetical protein
MKRFQRNFSWIIVLGFLVGNLFLANPGWTADNVSQRLSAPPVFIFLPLILRDFLVATPAQKAAILGAEMFLLASEEGS